MLALERTEDGCIRFYNRNTGELIGKLVVCKIYSLHTKVRLGFELPEWIEVVRAEVDRRTKSDEPTR